MHPDKKTKGIEWTIKDLKEIYRLRHDEGKSFIDVAKIIKTKTWKSIARKYGRINWEAFLKDPEAYSETTVPRKWTNDEMIRLDAFLQSGKSYDFIAEKLGRKITSIESQAQHTDWKAWRALKVLNLQSSQVEKATDVVKQEELIDQLIGALLEVCRYEFARLESAKEKEFLERVNLEKDRLPISFTELKEKCKEELVALGFGNPENIDLGAGTYVIVGDSHGKHTKRDMFALLERINTTLKPNKIIHVGHILDDDNDISYDWGKFSNLIVVAKVEELRTIQDQRNKFKFNYQISRDSVTINDLVITNQDLISDYVKTPISNLDAQIFDEKVVVNCHRLEFSTRCCNSGASYFASPGCLCENHIVRTIKQIDFEDGRVIKQANHDGFVKYRRMRQLNNYWEQGMIVVQMDQNKNYTMVPCAIKHTAKGFATSYFDKIIASKGVFSPDSKIFVNGDMHCDKHDVNVLDMQEQICKDYAPDTQVNVGDTFNYSSLNHHIMDRGGVIVDKKVLDEAAQANYVLNRVSKWAKTSHLIYGNHERFAGDFIEKFPQFEKLLDFRFICDVENLGYHLTSLKNVLKIGSVKFVHGEIKMYGQTGSKLEKASRTFGSDIFIGHIHRPEIRFGCYSIGLSGCLDQDYNEPDASNWLHGFGMCNQFMGQSWLTTVAIVNDKCVINGRTYSPSKNVASWKPNKYRSRMIYKFDEQK